MIDKENATYSHWYIEYNWNDSKSCYLNSKEYGNYLSSYIRNQKNGLVLNLNGEWGTGKTIFLKQLYTNLLNEHNIPTVYINAWKSDFSDDPLLVIISELLDQMSLLFISDNDNKADEKEKKKTELLSKLALLGKKTYNGGLDIVAAYISTKNTDWETGLDATALTSVANHLKLDDKSKVIQVDEPRFGKSLAENYKKQLKAIEDTKALMSEYARFICNNAHNSDSKIYILIDELDRCRPSYAIEFLETVKHFFDIPNFVFVIATDTQQLSHSIKAVYGNDFNGNEYLSRFFNRTATLPTGNIRGLVKKFIENSNIMESFSKGIMLPSKYSEAKNYSSDQEFVVQEITNIAILYDIKPRRINQLIAKFDSILIEAYDTPNVIFDFRILLQLLAEYSTDGFYSCYVNRKTSKIIPFKTSQETIDYFNWGNYNSNHIGNLMRNKKILKGIDIDRNIKSSQAELYFQYRYDVSWMMVSHMTTAPDNLKNVYDLHCNEIKNNHSSEVISKHKMILLSEHSRIIQESHQSGNNPHREFWTKDTYFKKVEISDSLS